MFNHLVKAGLSEDFAYVISFNAAPMANTVEDALKYGFKDQRGGHRAWRLFSLPALKNFLDRDFGPELDRGVDAPWRTHQGLYGGVDLCIPTGVSTNPPFGADLYNDPIFRELLRKYRKADEKEEGYRPPNPFSQPAPIKKEDDLSYQEIIDVAAPYLRKEGYKA
jgi:hypothetical protein